MKKDPQIQGTERERDYFEDLEAHFKKSSGSFVQKLQDFPKYVPRQSLSLFLAKHELFKKILNIHGSIIEGGVHLGGGLMTWAQLSAIFEPVNYQRQVIGFDTFEGFPSIGKEDARSESGVNKKGGLAIPGTAYRELQDSIALYDRNRFVSHIPKVKLVKGDVKRTVSAFLKENPQTVVSLLYLDFDLYEPTKIMLEKFLPRMGRGAVLAFDEVNSTDWSGETLAVLKTVGIRSLKLERDPIVPKMSFAVLE